MYNYYLLTDPQVKKIYLDGFNEGQIRKKTFAEIFSNEWEIYIESKFQFATKSFIKEIKVYENGVTSIYTRGENTKFEEIVYNENFDWNLVYTVEIDKKEFSIGDKIIQKEHYSKHFTIERFGLSTQTYGFKQIRNVIEVYVSEITSGYFAELQQIDEFKEPFAFTYDGKAVYENETVFVYNTVSKSRYPVTASKFKDKNENGILVKSHNLKEENDWLIFSSIEAIKVYEKNHNKKYSLVDLKKFLAQVADSTGNPIGFIFDEMNNYFK